MSSSEVAIALDSLYLHPQFSGDFGSAATPLGISAVLVRHRGSGNFYYECSDDGATSGFTTDCLIDPSNRDADIQLGSGSTPADGSFKRISLTNGKTTIKSTIVFDAAAVVNVQESQIGGRTICIIGSGVPTLPTFNHHSGMSVLSNVITNLNVAGGECIKDTNKATDVHVFGGVLRWRHKTVGGDGVSITVHAGGELDLTDESGDPKTISLVIRKPGGVIRRQADLHAFTTFIDEAEA